MQDNNCIIVVRHGWCEWHDQGRFIGQMDVPLSVKGIEDAKRVAEKVAKFMPSYLVSSDLLRARNTAIVISNRCNIPMKVDERLREENLGGWTGLLRQDVKSMFPEEYKRWCNGDVFEPYGEREGLTAVARRACLAINETISNSCGQTIVVVTHLNTAIAIIARMLDLPQNKLTILGDLVPGAFSVISCQSDNRWILTGHNILN